jgi:hypothetical protein
VGTFRRYAPNASPTIRMRKPMRYVANEDMGAGAMLVSRARGQNSGQTWSELTSRCLPELPAFPVSEEA